MLTFGDPQLLKYLDLVWWEYISNTAFQPIARLREKVAQAGITIPFTDLTWLVLTVKLVITVKPYNFISKLLSLFTRNIPCSSRPVQWKLQKVHQRFQIRFWHGTTQIGQKGSRALARRTHQDEAADCQFPQRWGSQLLPVTLWSCSWR